MSPELEFLRVKTRTDEYRGPAGVVHPCWAMVLLLGAASFLSCCSKEAPQQEASAANQRMRDGGPPKNLEFQPIDRRLFEHAGTLDRANQYVFTVMVTALGAALGDGCSGVLLHSRLVLTAAHCVCPRQHFALQDAGQGTLIEAMGCAARASVTSVAYESSANPERPTLRLRSYEGQVRPHPGLQILLDASGAAKKNDADLAVIFLDHPVEFPGAGMRLADSEVQAQESLTMAGYGHDRVVGSRHGARYFRKNQVIRAPTLDEGWALYAQQGAALYEGFDGGPCFREDERGRWLMGIAGVNTSEGLSFASTFFYRDWLRAELQRAEVGGKTDGTP